MADVKANRHGSLIEGAKANPRLRRRKWAVIRLRAYGLIAIGLAVAALIAVLGSVVAKSFAAMSESYVTLPVTLDASEIDPDGTKDPKQILRANFGGLTKDALKAAFPAVKKRKQRKQLYQLVSGGAAFELAETVAAQPDLIGQTIDFRFLASDVTDLYLKGSYGKLRPQATAGRLSVVGDGKKLRISTTADDFAEAMEGVKAALLQDAARLRRNAALQNNGAAVFARRAQAAAGEERDRLQAQADARAAERDKLIAQAEALEARAGAESGTEKLDRDNRSLLIRAGGGWIKLTELDAAQAVGVALTPVAVPIEASSDWQLFETDLPEASRKVSDLSIALIEDLRARGAIHQVFNWRFFSASDSREPELAGIRGAAVGSFWTMLVTFLLSFPVGVLAAIYLEEFAPRNRLTAFIEVNINNLAAVPSIIFGLLGLAIFLGVFGVPRSSPLAGGIVMALMTLPTIIIAARVSIAAVPPSIREAALGVGASQVQTAFHHVLPLALPGIMTGTIIGMARALGETAPLIMIGMVAFIVDVPKGILDSATVLPVQIYRWSDFPERAFEARTGAAIMVLLIFLVAMNALAIVLRRRFERRW